MTFVSAGNISENSQYRLSVIADQDHNQRLPMVIFSSTICPITVTLWILGVTGRLAAEVLSNSHNFLCPDCHLGRHQLGLGVQAARMLLDSEGLQDVKISRAHGMLSDHYNPMTRSLALSKVVYNAQSIASIGVATHEAGHAIQHAQHYKPLWLRSLLVPTANIGSSIGYFVMLIGLIFASQGISSPTEREGVDKVLNAAALTYVAAAVSTLLTLLYFLIRAGLLGGRDR